MHTGTAATAAQARDLQPDVILLAAGGRHEIPDIPGIHRRKVLTGEHLHHTVKLALRASTPAVLRRLAGGWLPLVGKDVVVIGGRLHGCQTAEFLVHCGRRVTIVDTGSPDLIGDGLVEVFLKPYLLYWLEDHGVEIVSDVRCEEVTGQGLVVTMADGTRRSLAADTVITALPPVPNTAIRDEFAGCAPDVREIGDAHEPGLIFHAIAAGAQVGRAI